MNVGRHFGNGEFHSGIEKAYLAVAEPLDACRVLRQPPSLHTKIYSPEDSPKSTNVQVKWVALITGGGGCDLKTKVIHATDAGYARAILKITHPDDVLGYSNLYRDNDIQIDFSLVNPADWDTIQNYAHPKPYVIVLPSFSKTENENTPSFFFMTIGRICDFVHYIVNLPFTLVSGTNDFISRCVKELVISPLKLDLMSTSEIIYSFACFLIPGLMLLTPLVYGWARSNIASDYYHRNENARPHRRNENRQRVFGNRSNDETARIHRRLLNLDERQPLTKQLIGEAYRREAPNYHPDRNQGRPEPEVAERTAHFRRLTEARDYLLDLPDVR
ncbi:Chaperone protein DnaJ [Orchesella cincta]|uniref:Chaperone protein DnaJ n=1 Tax=Orchesella cincta TaxID=48709 RepID=A0A1D2MQ05_ORCCI|nr:Chaperone protein DnaJ [Orchesella cincta]